jgi:hypothetical protein
MDLRTLLGMQPQANPLQSLLGQYYNPQALQQQTLSSALTGAGLGLLSMGPSPVKPSLGSYIGAAAKGGILGGMQGQEDYKKSAIDAYSLDREKTRDEQELRDRQKAENERMTQKKALWDYTDTIGDPSKRDFLRAFPQYGGKAMADSMFPDPNADLDRQYKQAQIRRYNQLADGDAGMSNMPADVREYEYAKSQGFQGTYMDWKKNASGGKGDRLSATEAKALWSAQDELPAVDGTIQALQRAKELNRKTFTGMGAGAAGWAGTSIPGASMVLDPEKAAATREFQQIMSREAITAMSETLKGATTNFEMSKFEAILADPTTPPDIRENVIDRMLQLAQAQKAIKQQRIQELTNSSEGASGKIISPSGVTNGVPWSVE